MEEIKFENELKLCDVKEDNICKTMEKIKSAASDVLFLTLQWSDLKDHFKSSKDNLENRYREVVSKEVELQNRNFALEERAKVVEAAEAGMAALEMKSNFYRSEIEEKGEELGLLRKSLDECYDEHRSKAGQLNELVELLSKTQVDLDLKRERLSQMETDLERYHVEVNVEKEHLGRIANDRRELEVDIEQKRRDLALVVDKITECEKLFETKSSELLKTQGEVDLKGKQLEQMNIDLQRHRDEISSERDHLDKSQTRSRELEEEIERKRKDLTVILDQIAENGKQLELAENQLDSQQKLFETLSSKLIKIKTEVDLKGQLLEQMNFDLERHRGEISAEMEHLDRSQTRNRELDEEIESKKKDFTSRITEYEKQLKSMEERLASQQKLLEKQSLELVSKKKELDGLHLDLDLADSLNNEMKETCQQIKSKAKELAEIERLIKERTGQNESIKLLLEEHSEELASKEKRQHKITEAIHKLSLEIVTKEKTIQQLLEKQNSKQKKLDSIEKNVEKADAEFVLKKKELRSVKDTYAECIHNWEIKQKELKAVQEEVKKIQSSLKDLHSVDAEQVKLKASLMEREKELGLKEKQLCARSETIELKEKKLDAREEKLDKKDEQLKSTEQKVAKIVKDYELKAKKLASFCQQNKPDQQVDLARDASVSDEKTLQLLLHGLLMKRHNLHLDVLSALKASSDPAKLVLVTIQGLHERMVVAKLEPDSVNRSSICLLECLMGISPKPNTDLQGDAIESATEWKNKSLVKAENPMEALGFLHFLAAFSLAYTFDANKVHSLFDAAFLHQYVPSLFNNVLYSLDGRPEQQPSEAPSHLGNEDALLDPEGSASFSPNEVFTGLRLMPDPYKYVLNLVNDELMGAQQRGELGLTEPIVKHLVSFLEELPRVVGCNKNLLSYALQVANRWRMMMGNGSQILPLEAWGFLHFIVAYGLAHKTNQDDTFRFALKVVHFKQAPKLFKSLGLSSLIPNLVRQLLDKCCHFLAIRFIFYFELYYNFPSLEFLTDEIASLRRSAKDKRRFDSQAEERDAAKLKDIIELIEDFKLEIDLPVELIVRFMVPRVIQNQNQYMVSSYDPTSLGGSPTQQVLQLETYQAGGSTVVHGQSSDRAGFKRPRMDPSVSRAVMRPCYNPSSYGRF